MALTPKQKKFIDEYLKDLNATQAAIRAGYSEKTAYSIGQENLKKPEIKKFIELSQSESSSRSMTTVDTIDEMHKEAYKVAKEIGQPSAMTAAAANLAKLHGLIVDKVQEVEKDLTPWSQIKAGLDGE